ncbi:MULTISPECIES: LPS export ABC transporter periplasmic protein LptC [Methylosinus]|uniref:LPS export ABC transporter periplasmic protein LptC n=1 Tax=Methylosinus trichosporium (strain ATCC 35070 / NCIMB 11131 / UNIQEM 75 / OB3b) TaxID=595536 RepID=A0A2D2D0J1_METT3|nr:MULTISPECIES: LPS export ABC transporter periplasmic protein LptC [Methylosinus]ATQ68521.1 LPS export ABC transporter periplasmic protein LptC [Methylosinus trichosporium OB3b]OBS53946.1 LPS export ABC transporter periplasmic protein LptC [Methylosinus sp. 3S-1]
MSDDAVSPSGLDRLDGLIAARPDAIPEARRHTQRVARLRRFLIWGSAGIVVAALLGALVRSLSFLPVNLSFSRIVTQGTRITIESPKLVAYRKDGRPYELRARTAVQDLDHPDIYELNELEVRITNDSDGVIILTSQRGVYDGGKDEAALSGDAHIYDGTRFDMKTAAATIDFRGGLVTSTTPTTLMLDESVVTAQACEFSQTEKRATFTGAVHTTFPGDEDAPPEATERLFPVRDAPETDAPMRDAAP